MWRDILDTLFVRALRTRFDRLWQENPASPPSPKQRRSRRLAFESLEPRFLLSADLALTDGILRITGTDADDSLFIQQIDSQIKVVLDGESSSFDAARVSEIHASLLDGDDSLTLDHSFMPLSPPVSFDGGAGNDALNITTDTGPRAERIDVGPSSERTPGPIQVQVVDLAGGAANTSCVITGVEEDAVNAGADDEFALDNRGGALSHAFLKFKFDTVFTTKIDWSGPGDEGPEESITFVYGKLGLKYIAQEPGSQPVVAGWDQMLNQAAEDFAEA